MLTHLLLRFTLLGAGWVLWLLAGLSLFSIAVMIERALYFGSHNAKASPELLEALRQGDREGARKALGDGQGIVADVVRAGLDHADAGPDSVESVIAGELARARAGYDRYLVVLGTLGNNAPFIGLFGTVLGVIRAFADLAASAGKGGSTVVMAGIADALVATAVGLFVALPAVVAFNAFGRWRGRRVADATAAGHALLAGLRGKGEGGETVRKVI